MGILKKAVDKEVRRYLNDMKAESEYEYNRLITPDRISALRDRYTRAMLINSVWYSGVDIELKQLYERDIKAIKIGAFRGDELNYFWGQPTEDTNIRKLHTGIPQLISEKMVDLIMANGYDISVYKNRVSNEMDDDNYERLIAILEDNQFDSILQEAIETASWSGGVAIKLSTNDAFEYPIVEAIQPEEYEPVVKAGRIMEDVFIKYFNKDKRVFKLKEHYGYGYIRYALYEKNGDNWISASLSELEETRNLKDETFSVKKKFSVYIPNKLPNSDFRGSSLGESDYSGSHGLFDALDEVMSTMVQEFRDGKIKNFWASNLLPVDPHTNQTYLPPALKKDFITYNSGIGENEKATKPEMVQGEIHSEKYVQSFNRIIESILNNAGLSPQTIGMTGLDSVASSADSQELREKASVRTREKKIRLLAPQMNKLFELMLILDDIYKGNAIGDYDVDVAFKDYKIMTFEDKVDNVIKAVQGDVMDIRTAVIELYPNKTDDDINMIVRNIKIEKGIPLLADDMGDEDLSETDETPMDEETEDEVLEEEIIEEDDDADTT